jgi:aminoglycoside phosphotransferase family enzyme
LQIRAKQQGFSMTDHSQSEVIAFLSDKANLPGHAPVKIVQTHGALVFLSGADAYKIKRDVRYDYLDFSTLQKRHDMLMRELELNAPMAPSIYRDVLAVTRDAQGRLRLDGTGDVVEWVLRMNRFEAADELDKVAARGALDDPLAARLGQVIAGYHATTPPRPARAGSDLIEAILD